MDARRLHREWERLKRERLGHSNRIQGLLITQGSRLEPGADFLVRLYQVTSWDGSALPGDLKAELVREYERLKLVGEQIKTLVRTRRERLKNPQHDWLFVTEFFGWRGFRNGKQVGALAGLTGMPYSSGDSARDQGISKAGNRRVRAMAIEIAWLWLRWQPKSALSQWFNERFALGGKRMRRIGIVAVARRLLVALWRYLEDGVMPEGARMIPAKF